MTAVDNYTAVNEAWPASLPAITREEARRAARKLMRHFAKRESRWLRPIWISARPLSNGTARGWWRLVHDVSHRVFYLTNNRVARGHGGWHAELEFKMVRYVLEHGWLDGRLRSPEPTPPTLDERRARKLAHAERMLAQWERRQKIAETRVRFWKRLVRRRDREWVRAQPEAATTNGGQS